MSNGGEDQLGIVAKHFGAIIGTLLLLVAARAIVTWADTQTNTEAIKVINTSMARATDQRYRRSDAEHRRDDVDVQLRDLQKRLAHLEGAQGD